MWWVRTIWCRKLHLNSHSVTAQICILLLLSHWWVHLELCLGFWYTFTHMCRLGRLHRCSFICLPTCVDWEVGEITQVLFHLFTHMCWLRRLHRCSLSLSSIYPHVLISFGTQCLLTCVDLVLQLPDLLQWPVCNNAQCHNRGKEDGGGHHLQNHPCWTHILLWWTTWPTSAREGSPSV